MLHVESISYRFTVPTSILKSLGGTLVIHLHFFKTSSVVCWLGQLRVRIVFVPVTGKYWNEQNKHLETLEKFGGKMFVDWNNKSHQVSVWLLNFIYLVTSFIIFDKKLPEKNRVKETLVINLRELEKLWFKPIFPDLFDQRNSIIGHPVNSLRN